MGDQQGSIQNENDYKEVVESKTGIIQVLQSDNLGESINYLNSSAYSKCLGSVVYFLRRSAVSQVSLKIFRLRFLIGVAF